MQGLRENQPVQKRTDWQNERFPAAQKNRRNKKMHDGFPHGAYFAALLTFRLTCPLAGSHLRSSTFRLFTLTFETSPSYKNEPRISPQLAVNGGYSSFSFFTTVLLICSSRICFSSTMFGAWLMTSTALCVFGKAMTSRMDGRFAMSMMRRSRPKARPP